MASTAAPFTTARHTNYFPASDMKGKWHAGNKITETALCGSPVVLDLRNGPLVVDSGTTSTKVHPLVCRRCLRLAASPNYTPRSI